jgi:hypothetical protein
MARKKSSRKVHKASAKNTGKLVRYKNGKMGPPIPINVLEKRLKRLYSVVESRNGSLPS